MAFLKSLNWVDIYAVVLAVRIVYTSFKTGFVVEFMKTLATLLAVFVSFHFYIRVSEALGHRVALARPLLEVLVFAGIWFLIMVLIKFARDGILMIFTVQTVSMVDKWGAVALSIVRFILTASMFMFIFLLTDQPYMERMTYSSLAQRYILSVAPDTYQKIDRKMVLKFFPLEKVNPAVAEELKKPGKK